jgi:hypothetical protein
LIVHIVLLRFRNDLTEAELGSFTQLVREACSEIPTVMKAYVGMRTDVDAGYQRNFGESTYDAAAVLHFEDKDGLIAYLRHPRHAELGRAFWAISSAAVVFETDVEDLVREATVIRRDG